MRRRLEAATAEHGHTGHERRRLVRRFDRARSEGRHRAFRRLQFGKKVATTVAGAVFASSALMNAATPADGLFDATKRHDRWSIKTSIPSDGPLAHERAIDIAALDRRLDITKDQAPFERSLIPDVVQGLQEGQTVTTVGYIHLVAFEAGDSDYHIQMNENPTNAPSGLEPCVVVEIPHPNSTGDPILSAEFASARKFIRDNCFHGSAPTGAVDPPLRVKVTGQLFYDLFHAQGMSKTGPGGGRGKNVHGSPMEATTIWEIHPVTSVTFAPP